MTLLLTGPAEFFLQGTIAWQLDDDKMAAVSKSKHLHLGLVLNRSLLAGDNPVRPPLFRVVDEG
jgi:hypothetical protein